MSTTSAIAIVLAAVLGTQVVLYKREPSVWARRLYISLLVMMELLLSAKFYQINYPKTDELLSTLIVIGSLIGSLWVGARILVDRR